MGETAASAPQNVVLQSSISFGKYENDSSLSWEKWSTFSPNKYLEEVEKFSTPGSVAEKKAYFESQYKKIAARKAELLEQEKLIGVSYLISNDHGEELIRSSTAEANYEIDASMDRNFEQEIKQDRGFSVEDGGEFFEVPNEDDLITIECYSMPFERAREDVSRSLYSSSFGKSEEEESTIKEIQEVVPPTVLPTEDVGSKLHIQENEDREVGIAPISHNEASKVSPPSSHEEPPVLNPPQNPQKITKVVKEKSTPRIKKKPVSSPVQKSPPISTPQRVSKTVASSTVTPASRSSTMRGTTSSLPRTRTPTSEGNYKKVAPKSLHSLNSPSPQAQAPSLSAPRKSSIMEKMGDKDIVKRAFRMFQNDLGKLNSPADEKPSKQVPFGGTEIKATATLKSNGSDKPKVRAAIQKGPRAPAPPPSSGLRNSETAEKHREVGRKSVDRSDAKKTPATVKHIQPKPKEEKEAAINTSKQSSSSRTRSLSQNRGEPRLKNGRAKDEPKNKLLQ